MNQPAPHIDLSDLDNELDKAIGELAAGFPVNEERRAAVAKMPRAFDYPFKGNSAAEALHHAAEADDGNRPSTFRSRHLSEAARTPIPPQHPAPQPAPAATAPQPESAPSEQAIVNASPTSSEVEKFMAIGEQMLDTQRRKIQALESAYEIDRVKLIDDYRVKLRELEHEANEALRSFDLGHQAALGDAKRILDALTAMRG